MIRTGTNDYGIPAVEHEVEGERRGFDTTFMDPDEFKALLDRHNLNSNEVVHGSWDYKDTRLWAWYNDDVLLVTSNNPLTGETSNPNGRDDSEGCLGYVGIEGDIDAVEALWHDIEETAESIKDRNPFGRSFV